MANQIILLGSGGHASSLIDVIECVPDFEVAGMLDHEIRQGASIRNYMVKWHWNDLYHLVREGFWFLVAEGGIPKLESRQKLFDTIVEVGGMLPVIVSPQAYVSRNCTIAEGTVVFHKSLVNANARIGRNCIINSCAVLEHDTSIGDHCHISTNATVNGGVTMGERCFVGSGAVILQALYIEDACTIGANSLLKHDAIEAGMYVGNPALKL